MQALHCGLKIITNGYIKGHIGSIAVGALLRCGRQRLAHLTQACAFSRYSFIKFISHDYMLLA
jgi:hypothetical protein